MKSQATLQSQKLALITLGTALFFALGVCAIFVSLAGESPIAVARVFLSGSLGTPYDIGLSMFYAIPIALAGLAVSVGLRSGLFNIGVEGQLMMGTLGAALTAKVLEEQSWWLMFTASALAALLAGFLWASILGWLKAARGAHEVVSGIMLNTLAYGFSSWIVLQFFRNTESQNPESSPIAENARFRAWEYFQGAPLSWHVLLVPLFALVIYLFYRWTRVGFALTWVASAPGAAKHAGFPLRTLEFWALALGGILAGAIGIAEVFGNTGRYVVGFSPGYGFIGIAVALLGRLHPFGIIFASLVFGALYKGSLELDFETQEITKDFALILQAVMILFLSCELPESWRKKLLHKEPKR